MSKNYYNCLDGYFYKENIYRDRPLKYLPYGQCGIIEQGKHVYLKSYTTMVLDLDRENGWLYCTGLYSRTTIKHIGKWLKEICPNVDYYTVKAAYNNGMVYNVYTGELMSKADYLKGGR